MQFGWHCDPEVDVENVAIREFHEESWIEINPNMMSGILSVQLWEIAERTSSSGMFQPAHIHYDLLFLWSIPEDTPFARQESEVDDIRWLDINWIEKYIAEPRMLYMIEKIKTLKNV